MTLTVFLPILEESAYKKSLKGYSGLCLYLPRKIKGMNVFKKHNDEQLSGPNCSSITYGFSPQLQALHRNTIQRNESASLKKKRKLLAVQSHLWEAIYCFFGLKQQRSALLTPS